MYFELKELRFLYHILVSDDSLHPTSGIFNQRLFKKEEWKIVAPIFELIEQHLDEEGKFPVVGGEIDFEENHKQILLSYVDRPITAHDMKVGLTVEQKLKGEIPAEKPKKDIPSNA